MSQPRTLRIRDVSAYLGVSHQRVTQMHAEGKLTEPDQIDGNRAVVEADDDRAVGPARVVGDAALEDSPLDNEGLRRVRHKEKAGRLEGATRLLVRSPKRWDDGSICRATPVVEGRAT